jgi:hypothetical protein
VVSKACTNSPLSRWFQLRRTCHHRGTHAVWRTGTCSVFSSSLLRPVTMVCRCFLWGLPGVRLKHDVFFLASGVLFYRVVLRHFSTPLRSCTHISIISSYFPPFAINIRTHLNLYHTSRPNILGGSNLHITPLQLKPYTFGVRNPHIFSNMVLRMYSMSDQMAICVWRVITLVSTLPNVAIHTIQGAVELDDGSCSPWQASNRAIISSLMSKPLLATFSRQYKNETKRKCRIKNFTRRWRARWQVSVPLESSPSIPVSHI